MQISVDIDDLEPGDRLLAPAGMTTPYDQVERFEAEGAVIVEAVREPRLDLVALRLRATAHRARLVWHVEDPDATVSYPEAVFRPHDSSYTRAAEALAARSRDIAAQAGGGRNGIEALVAEAESRFVYAHPEQRFTDGHDTVPPLSCGTTPGSCIDINTYLMASLRAAGYEAGYLFGYFFPAESAGATTDHHCWVVTRHAGTVLEWDIAHHLKAGLGPTRPGLNPRPGSRVALGHSMGHCYPTGIGEASLRLLAEPHRQGPDGHCERLSLTICRNG